MFRNNSASIKGRKGKKRAGYTMIEVTIVIVILGVIAAVSYDKLNTQQTEVGIKDHIGQDFTYIMKAANDWRSNSLTSDGTFKNITTDEIISGIPGKMDYTGGVLTGTGWNKGCAYEIISDKIDPGGSSGDSIKILVDCSAAKATNHWDDRTVLLLEQTIANTGNKFSSDKTDGGQASKDATALAAKDVAFTTGGTNADAIVGVRNITF